MESFCTFMWSQWEDQLNPTMKILLYLPQRNFPIRASQVPKRTELGFQQVYRADFKTSRLVLSYVLHINSMCTRVQSETSFFEAHLKLEDLGRTFPIPRTGVIYLQVLKVPEIYPQIVPDNCKWPNWLKLVSSSGLERKVG